MTETKQQKVPVPKPDQILNQLLSPSDVLKQKQLDRFTNIAESNTDRLRAEMDRRNKLSGVKTALENEDLNMLREAYRDLYGESMIDAGKQLLISMLSLKGHYVDDEVHLEESIGQWIKRSYDEGGLKGVYNWATQIDTATQVVSEYKVVFDSEQAKKENRDKRSGRYSSSFIRDYFSQS